MKNKLFLDYLSPLVFLFLLGSSFFGTPKEEAKEEYLPTLDYAPVAYAIHPVDTPIKDQSTINLREPANKTQEVTYDPATNTYNFQNKIGTLNDGYPTNLSLDEYLDYDIQKSMKKYWRERAGVASGGESGGGIIPQIRVPSEIFENIFGSNLIDIRPSGSLEIIFKLIHTRTQNENVSVKNRNQTSFDFDANIQLNLKAKIGDKIAYDLNYNTLANFDFENKFKLRYEGKEDEIIKLLEFGNVTMPLSSSLIQGSQTLFGLKTQLQFGKLMLTALVANQEGDKKTITVSGGSELNEYNFRADEYEEDRHFFLAQYFYEHYNEALSTLPLVNSKINITRIEVWRTNIGSAVTENRNIIALTDLGEANPYHRNVHRTSSRSYPNPNANDLLQGINYNQLNDINSASTYLRSYRGGMTSGIDFEKVESARLLNSNEYTFNSKLGFISLNTRLNSDQVLAVAFQYTILGDTTVYQVGQFSNEVETPKCIMVKLLKSSSVNTKIPLWKLMMKNVYSLNTYQLSAEKFRLNILYKGEETGIPMGYFTNVKEEYQGIPLIRLLGADRLNLQQAAIPDGVYDWVDNAAIEGGTVQSSTGRIYFPVVEPFGKDLRKVLANDLNAADFYAFDSLYTTTKVLAQQLPEKNKFYLEGSFKSALGSIISLGMSNISQGSVTVSAGGIQLQENVDFTVDYNMGTLRITNESYLQSGTPLNIAVESQNLFGQKKNMFGLNAEYAFSKNFLMGATILNLRERIPDGQMKVNFGDEPINNTIWGMNISYQTTSRWLTKMLNHLPFYSSTTDSRIQFNGEFAHFIPGHSRLIGRGNKAELYIDDFEAATTTYDLRWMSAWKLASTPQYQTKRGMFPEAAPTMGLEYGYNRAKLAWYNIDQVLLEKSYSNSYFNGTITADLRSEMYARRILIREVFPNRDVLTSSGEDPYLTILDLAYYPSERGPYNYDALGRGGISAGLNPNGTLKDPMSRWAGIMRKLDNPDFESSNVEYLQFWVLDPFLDSINHKGGDFYINLGDISEDILRDGRKSFEHGLPSNGSDEGVEYTIWGRVPVNQSIVMAFDADLKSRRYIDVGFDGLYDSLEQIHFASYLSTVQGILDPSVYDKFKEDPSADNYKYFRDVDYDNAGAGIIERYKQFNNPDGNSPTLDDRPADAISKNYLTQSSSLPDMEDINFDNTMSEDERYYQYKIEMKPGKMNIGENYITDIQKSTVTLENGTTRDVVWYQFKVPVREPDEVIGAISGFNSIRFMRMFLKGFEQPVVLRFADISLVRGAWRSYTDNLRDEGNYPPSSGTATSFNVSTVNLEENSKRAPISYVMPSTVQREYSYVNQTAKELNEQSLSLRVTDLEDGDRRAVYKNTSYDFRRFGSLRLYLHGEKVSDYDDLNRGDLKLFIRLGSDFKDNYYEFETPFDLTAWGESDPNLIWPEDNNVDINLQVLIDSTKQRRNYEMRHGATFTLNDVFSWYDGEDKFSVKGSPTLSDVRIIMIGVYNPSKKSLHDNDDMLPKSVEIWVNELRLGDFEEKGGWAALGNVRVDLADLGDVSLSASISTAGFGPLESRTYDRQQEQLTTLDLATNLQLGKLLPSKWNVNLPVHYDFSRNVGTPEYNPLNPDVKLKADLETYDTKVERDSIKRQALDVVQRQNFNIINARKDRGTDNTKKARFWDFSNFDFSYAYTEVKMYNIDYVFDNTFTHNGGFGYAYSTQPFKVKPFNKAEKMKKIKWLQLITDFNFMLYPKSFSFRTDVYRMLNESQLRNKSQGLIITETMFVKAFEWNRDYTLAWDLSEGLRFDYAASANAYINEPPGRIDTKDKKSEVWKSFGDFGKMNSFNQQFKASYQIPINKIPVFSFINSAVRYNATYYWTASPEAIAYLGNTIENSNTKQFNIDANFTTLYNKSKYLRKVNQGTFGSSLKDKPILKKKQAKPVDLSKLTRAQQDSVRKVDREKEQSKKNIGKEILDNFLRLTMLIKRVSFDYKEGNGTVLTGYMLTPDILGLNLQHNASPGFLFVFGGQNDDLRYIASQNAWLTKSDLLNTPYARSRNTNITAKVSLEPLKDLKIDLTGTRVYSYVDQSYYIPDSNGIYGDFSRQTTGNFSITTICTPTLFVQSEKGNYINEIFENFKKYRLEIANRLADNRAANKDDYTRGADDYPDGYGKLDQEVLLYAFLAAYSGKSPSSISISSPFTKIPLPNWQITYNGITKIPGVNKVFQNIMLRHSYTCLYQLGGFSTNMSYNPNDGNLQTIRDALNNFIPYTEVGQVAITEAMNPVISVDVTMKNSFQFKAEWRKSRTVTLSMANFQVTEVANNELIFGAGYRFKDLKITFDFAGTKRQTEGELVVRADFSIRDNKTILRKIEEETNTASAGQKILSIAVSGEYQITKNIFFKIFYDHIINNPALASQYKTLTINGGFSIRIMLSEM